jgi:hypothetical protein
VPEGRARGREEHGRETALARKSAQGHSPVGAPRGAPEAVGERGAKAGEFMVEREAGHENVIEGVGAHSIDYDIIVDIIT